MLAAVPEQFDFVEFRAAAGAVAGWPRPARRLLFLGRRVEFRRPSGPGAFAQPVPDWRLTAAQPGVNGGVAQGPPVAAATGRGGGLQ